MSTLYIDYAGASHPGLEWLATQAPALRPFARRLALDSTSRRNPRSAEYMARLVTLGPDDSLVSVTSRDALDESKIRAATRIVLLWRDSNGCGCWAVERHILRHRRPDCPVQVVTGRRREFGLTTSSLRACRLRRFLEKSMIPEVTMVAAFAIATPFVVVWDLLKGRH